jgi:hypothetical protein
MVNEFHTLRGSCSNLVPQGPGYENVSLDNQVCTTVGSVPGQPYVEGERFVELSYEFYYSNLRLVGCLTLLFDGLCSQHGSRISESSLP